MAASDATQFIMPPGLYRVDTDGTQVGKQRWTRIADTCAAQTVVR